MQERETNHILLYLTCEQMSVWNQRTPKIELGHTTPERMARQFMNELCTGVRQFPIKDLCVGARQLQLHSLIQRELSSSNQ
jgi:hypothetical protein